MTDQVIQMEQGRTMRRMPEEDIDFASEVHGALLQRAPKGGRLIVWLVLVFLVVAGFWANWATLDQVTRGQGKVIPSRQIQVVQNLEGGIIEGIEIKEGDIVEKGQVLLRIDDTRFSASMRESRLEYLALKAKAARLRAEAKGTRFVVPSDVAREAPRLISQEKELYRSRMAQYRKNFGSVERELEMTRPLVADGAISEVEVLRLERQLNEIKGEFRNKAKAELNEAVAQMSALNETGKALKDRVARTTVRSPMRGTVKRIMINTVGGVVQPGMDLVEIVPLEDTLKVEAQVRPADIGFLHPGQPAVVKFSAYDFAIYGGLDGTVDRISADTIVDEQGESFYLVQVSTNQTHLGSDDRPLMIIPGMVATVDVLTGKKTVLDYLLKPVLRAREMALRER